MRYIRQVTSVLMFAIAAFISCDSIDCTLYNTV